MDKQKTKNSKKNFEKPLENLSTVGQDHLQKNKKNKNKNLKLLGSKI